MNFLKNQLTLFHRAYPEALLIAAWHWRWSITWRWALWLHFHEMERKRFYLYAQPRATRQPWHRNVYIGTPWFLIAFASQENIRREGETT